MRLDDGLHTGRKIYDLFPVMTTGLHCGRIVLPSPISAGQLFPVMTTGLHCGRTVVLAREPRCRLFPVMTTGLHCGVRFTR